MSRASELEAQRLASERTDNRCADMMIALEHPDRPSGIDHIAKTLLNEATYVAEQRKSGWKSRSDAHTAAGRILEQWAKDLAAYLERDKPPMRPPLETIAGPTKYEHLDPADGPISAQIASGLLSQVVTPDVARSIREAKTVDDKLDVAFGPVSPRAEMTGLQCRAGTPRGTEGRSGRIVRCGKPAAHVDIPGNERHAEWIEDDPAHGPVSPEGGAWGPEWDLPVTHITAAPANYAWCDATSGVRGYVGSATCLDCIARYDAYDAAANKALALGRVEPPAEFIPVLDDPATDGSVMIPQFSEPGAPPPRQTQQRLSFVQVREHGQARARGVDHRSYSQVQAFKECGVKYALSDLDTPAWWNVGGTALHYACEAINRIAAQAGVVEPWDIETLWTNCLGRATSEAIAEHPTVDTAHWRAAKKGVEGYDWWRINGVDMVRRWVTRLTWLYDQGWRIAEFNGTPAIEYDCPMWIGEIKVENIIDLVMTRDDGTLLIVDAKSGASAPDDTAQLGQYTHALDRHVVPPLSVRMQQVRIYGAYWLARTDALDIGTTDLRDLHPWDGIEYLITTMDAAESAGLYLPNKSKSDRFGCGSCGVKGLCPVGPS